MAARDLTVGLLAEIEAGKLRPVLFYEGEFASSSFLRLWSGFGDKTWNSQIWTGAGNLLAVDGIEETTESRSVGFKVGLTGVKIANLSIALQSCQQGLPGRIWLGALAADGTVVADPYLARGGLLNIPNIDDTGDTCTITVEYEDENAALLIPLKRRWTPDDQAIDYAGDDGFEYVASLQDAQVLF